jgi:hypothetical protein
MSVAQIIDPVLGTIQPQFLPGSSPAGVLSITAGNGISNTGTPANPILATNLIGAGGLTVSYLAGQGTITDTKTDVASVNGATGALSIAGAGGLTVNTVGTTITLTQGNPVSYDQVRLTNTQTQNGPASFGMTQQPKTILSFTLPAQFNNCNVFTFYIRSLTGAFNTPSSSPANIRIYPSDTSNVGNQGISVGAWDSTEGAMSFYIANGITISNNVLNAGPLIWNWKPSTPATPRVININTVLTNSAVAPQLNNFSMIFDIVGEEMVLA